MNRALIILVAGAAVAAGQVSWAQTATVAQAAVSTNAVDHFAMGVRGMQERKYASAAEFFERAVKAQPVYSEAYCNWGIALVQIGRQTVALDQQLKIYQDAAEKFSKSAEQNPNERLTFLLWSEVLVLIGDMPVDARVRLGCYQGAVEKCKRAVALGTTDWETYNKWGFILSEKLPPFATDDKTRVKLYREAGELFAKSAQNARFSSEVAPLYANWGSTLVRAARLETSTNDKSRILAEACEKFEKSARLTPASATAYLLWGNALIERGKLSHLRSDYRDAIDRLNACLTFNPKEGSAYYNLARVYTIQGNYFLAKEALRKMVPLDVNRTLLPETTRDQDFAPLWKDPEYLELVNPTVNRGIRTYEPPASFR